MSDRERPSDSKDSEVRGAADEEAGYAKKPYQDILADELFVAERELTRPASGLLLSGFSAGLDIGFGPFAMVVYLTLAADTLPDGLDTLMLAGLYAIGFVLVVFGRSELFTEHTTLAVLPILDRRTSIDRLGRLWGLIYAANLVGATAFSLLASIVGERLGIASKEAFAELADTLVRHSALTMFLSAILAGWLMGLMSWLVTAARETTGQLAIVLIVSFTIGLGSLHHSIAGTVEVLMGVFAADVSVIDYLRFLGSATAGNVVGGSVFVALLKYAHAVRSGEDA